MNRRNFMKTVGAGAAGLALGGAGVLAARRSWRFNCVPSGLTTPDPTGRCDFYTEEGISRIWEIVADRIAREGSLPVYRSYRKDEEVGRLVFLDLIYQQPTYWAPEGSEFVHVAGDYLDAVVESDHDLTGLYLGPAVRVPGPGHWSDPKVDYITREDVLDVLDWSVFDITKFQSPHDLTARPWSA